MTDQREASAEQPEPDDSVLYRPVPLLLDQSLWNRLQEVRNNTPEPARSNFTPKMIARMACRDMLNAIALAADPSIVFKALAAAGGPLNEDELEQRINHLLNKGKAH